MNNNKVKTATNKEFFCESFILLSTPGRLYIRVVKESLTTVASVFGDPKETAQLWWCNQYVANHTKLIAIVPEGNTIRVVLGKE